MEDIMESCYLDSVSMCPHQYRYRECNREKEHQAQLQENRKRQLPFFFSPVCPGSSVG